MAVTEKLYNIEKDFSVFVTIGEIISEILVV
jgi:hypothetical protein